MATLSFKVHVLILDDNAAGLSLRRLRMVPSMPAIGRLLANSGYQLLRDAASNKAAICRALICSIRDKPEPFSSTRLVSLMPCLNNQERTRASARCALLLLSPLIPNALSAPKVRKILRAMALSECLLTIRMVSASVSD